MKQFFYLIILVTICLFSGCAKMGQTQSQVERDCIVSLNLVGEITSTESPLTKASSNDLYWVKVYRGNTPFALGIYDHLSNVNIYLKQGSDKYRIVISLLRNGKTSLGDKYRNGYVQCARQYSKTPFYLPMSDYTKFIYWAIINQMVYSGGKLTWAYGYSSNSTSSITSATRSLDESVFSSYFKSCDISVSQIFDEQYPLCDDWFYGEVNDYSATGEADTIDLELTRCCFRVKYELSGVSDGEITIKIFNSVRTFIQNTVDTPTYSSATFSYAFPNLYSVWQYPNDYEESFTLSVSWLRGIGITEDYGTKTIKLKRNRLNNIKISMGNNDSSAGMNITTEAESSIGAESTTIPVQ